MPKQEWFPGLTDEEIERKISKLTQYQKSRYEDFLMQKPEHKRLALLVALSYPSDMREEINK